MFGRKLLAGVLVPLWVLGSSPVWAADTDEARAAVQRGDSAYKKKAYEQALSEYEAAWSLKRSYTIACKLAQAEAKLERKVDAAQHLRFCLDNYTDSSAEEKAVEGRFRKLFEELRKDVAELRVVVVPPEATMIVDGKALERLPGTQDQRPVYVLPGEHTVGARAAGHEPGEEKVTVTAGSIREVRFRLVPAKAVDAAGTPTEAPSRPAENGTGPMREPAPATPKATVKERVRPVLGPAVLGGVGGATLLAGVAMMVMGSGKKSDAESAAAAFRAQNPGAVCPGAAECPAIQDDLSAADSQRNLGLALAGIGGVMGIGATSWWWFGGTMVERAAWRVEPARRGVGLGVSGAF